MQSVGLFVDGASDERWLTLIGLMSRADNPGQVFCVASSRMRWRRARRGRAAPPLPSSSDGWYAPLREESSVTAAIGELCHPPPVLTLPSSVAVPPA